MFRFKIVISIIIFSLFLVGTSTIKNETREIEKKIYNLSKIIFYTEKDIHESQLDYSYLTSPDIIEKKIYHLDNAKYLPMDFSKIFLSMSNFLNLNNQYANQEIRNEEKKQKK